MFHRRRFLPAIGRNLPALAAIAAIFAIWVCGTRPLQAAEPGKDAARTPILLDTDIGTYVDDAFALGLAAASPELELRGVTTVGHRGNDRALMACRFLTAIERRDLPVAVAAEPLRVELANSKSGSTLAREVKEVKSGKWSEAILTFRRASSAEPADPKFAQHAGKVDEIRFVLPKGGELLVDDVLLYVPGE
jgi:hypothetical protein